MRIERRALDGILLLDKPAGLSSNAALQRVKRLYRADKAGHTGSLDPLATGLLPICFGQATKLSGQLLDADKTYRATVRLGQRTATGDSEGPVIEERSLAAVDAEALNAAIPGLLGEIDQVPPMYSALKRAGRPLYALAREGLEVERAPRRVVIHALQVLAVDPNGFSFEVRCSKGTYVRTLAGDWAARIGQIAHLTALRRLESGPFRAADMQALNALEALAGNPALLDQRVLPLAAALVDWPQIRVASSQADRLRRGQPCGPFRDAAPGRVAVIDRDGRALAIGEVDPDGLLHPRRWLGPADTGE